MPEFARFDGITIRLYSREGGHNVPHFHAIFGELETSIAIEDGKQLVGEMTRGKLRLIEAFRNSNVAALMGDWQRLNG